MLAVLSILRRLAADLVADRMCSTDSVRSCTLEQPSPIARFHVPLPGRVKCTPPPPLQRTLGLARTVSAETVGLLAGQRFWWTVRLTAIS